MARLALDAPRWSEPGLAVRPGLDRFRPWLLLVAFAVALRLLDEVGFRLTASPGGAPLLWPPAGLLLFAFLVAPVRWWGALVAIAFTIGTAAGLEHGRELHRALGSSAGAAAEALLAAWLVRRFSQRVTGTTVVGVAGLVAWPAVVRLLLFTAWRAVGVAQGEPFWEARHAVSWLGSVLGVATVGWFLVAFSEEPEPEERTRVGAIELVLAFATLAVAVAWLGRRDSLLPDEVLLVPPVMWLAVRFGPRGGSVGLTVAAIATVLAARLGHVHAGGVVADPHLAALSIQFLVGAVAAPTAFVAAVVAERAAAEQQRVLLARAMDQGADGIGIYAEDGTILWANAATSRFYGRPAAEVVGKRAWELVPRGSPEKWARRWKGLAEQGVLTLEQRTRSPDGRVVPWEITVAHVKGARRSVAVAALRDTSDRRRADEALRLAGIGALAAGVAHEINNPLASVVGNLALVRERLEVLREVGGGTELERFAKEWLEPIEDAEAGARRVRDVVAELRVFARSEEERGPVDVARAMRSALSLTQSEIQHRARLVTRIGEVPPVRGSEGRLAQAFANVLVNAARAIPEGASQENEVRVEVRARGTDVVVEVADSGVGMAAEVRARIFEPFFTTREFGEGSGLGLAVTHAIVSAMRGRIDVDSAPAAGTRLRITLPASGSAPASATPARPPPAAAARTEGKRLKILVVDDEPLVARSLQRILLREHDVEVTDRARDALDRIASGARYDAVLCDLMMPDVSGMALHDEVGILDPDLRPRIVFVTGGAFTEAARAFLDRVPNVRLEKPVDPATLREAVARIEPRG